MTRGQAAKVGDTRWSPNGYQYTRTADGWEFTHHLIAEKKLGRKLRSGERVRFGPKGRKCLDPDNIEVVASGTGSTRTRIAVLEARIAELQAQKRSLEAELADG